MKTVPSSEFVSLKIYDVLGKEVITLVNENKKPGTYKATFNATNLASGIYYYKLTTDNFIETKKMILLK
ncbi:MAG: T9SS type A sorting domain-containing protein [Ignavibacteriae bacterium]|nr:T9SS type A sorting domain-containing protein [Ignavibacteriota bacterium]